MRETDGNSLPAKLLLIQLLERVLGGERGFFVHEQRLHAVPPLVVGGGELFHDVGIRGGEVGLLTGIGLEVEELPGGGHGLGSGADDGVGVFGGGASGCFGRGFGLLAFGIVFGGAAAGGVGIDEMPAARADAAIGELVFLRVGVLRPAADVGEELPVGPLGVRILEQRDETAAFDKELSPRPADRA